MPQTFQMNMNVTMFSRSYTNTFAKSSQLPKPTARYPPNDGDEKQALQVTEAEAEGSIGSASRCPSAVSYSVSLANSSVLPTTVTASSSSRVVTAKANSQLKMELLMNEENNRRHYDREEASARELLERLEAISLDELCARAFLAERSRDFDAFFDCLHREISQRARYQNYEGSSRRAVEQKGRLQELEFVLEAKQRTSLEQEALAETCGLACKHLFLSEGFARQNALKPLWEGLVASLVEMESDARKLVNFDYGLGFSVVTTKFSATIPAVASPPPRKPVEQKQQAERRAEDASTILMGPGTPLCPSGAPTTAKDFSLMSIQSPSASGRTSEEQQLTASTVIEQGISVNVPGSGSAAWGNASDSVNPSLLPLGSSTNLEDQQARWTEDSTASSTPQSYRRQQQPAGRSPAGSLVDSGVQTDISGLFVLEQMAMESGLSMNEGFGSPLRVAHAQQRGQQNVSSFSGSGRRVSPPGGGGGVNRGEYASPMMATLGDFGSPLVGKRRRKQQQQQPQLGAGTLVSPLSPARTESELMTLLERGGGSVFSPPGQHAPPHQMGGSGAGSSRESTPPVHQQPHEPPRNPSQNPRTFIRTSGSPSFASMSFGSGSGQFSGTHPPRTQPSQETTPQPRAPSTARATPSSSVRARGLSSSASQPRRSQSRPSPLNASSSKRKSSQKKNTRPGDDTEDVNDELMRLYLQAMDTLGNRPSAVQLPNVLTQLRSPTLPQTSKLGSPRGSSSRKKEPSSRGQRFAHGGSGGGGSARVNGGGGYPLPHHQQQGGHSVFHQEADRSSEWVGVNGGSGSSGGSGGGDSDRPGNPTHRLFDMPQLEFEL